MTLQCVIVETGVTHNNMTTFGYIQPCKKFNIFTVSAVERSGTKINYHLCLKN